MLRHHTRAECSESGGRVESVTALSHQSFISARSLVVETIEAMKAAFIRPHLDSLAPKPTKVRGAHRQLRNL